MSTVYPDTLLWVVTVAGGQQVSEQCVYEDVVVHVSVIMLHTPP